MKQASLMPQTALKYNMKINSTIQDPVYEETIIGIVRKLPAQRVVQIVEFARFQEWQESNNPDNDETGDETWERLFDTAESEQLLAELVREALEDDNAGRTTKIEISEEGLLIPA